MVLMIMAQDFTAFEPVTSGLWLQKDYVDYGYPSGDFGYSGFDEMPQGKHELPTRTIMCGDKVMGTYTHERAVEIIQEIAFKQENINFLISRNREVDSHESTYYMPKE